MRPEAATITIQEKLAAVQRLLEDLRHARNDPMLPEYATFHAMRAIASDLMARLPGNPEATRRALGKRIADAVRSRTPDGYLQSHARGLAEELVGRWPVIEQALERFEREIQPKQEAEDVAQG